MTAIEEVARSLCPTVPKDNETRNPRYYNCWNSGLSVGLTGFEPATFCSRWLCFPRFHCFRKRWNLAVFPIVARSVSPDFFRFSRVNVYECLRDNGSLLAVGDGFRVHISLAQLAVERLIDKRVDGLGDAHDASEHDAPARVLEAAGCADGEHADENGHAEAD